MAEKLKSIIVTVTDDALKDIQQVADKLAALGMKVDQVMPVTGVISGSCAPNSIPALEKVTGVMKVEDEAVAQQPPPDSQVQ